MATRHVGAAIKRKEDRRFLTGQGTFTDDITLARQAYAVLVRSPHAHARVLRIDIAAARAVPGVLLVLTAHDVKGEIVRAIPSFSKTPPFDVVVAPEAAHWPLAADTVRYVGEPVAFVVAERVETARDAADRIVVEYDALEPVVDIDRALAPGAPAVWADVPGNVSFEWERGDAAAVESALARSAHVARVAVANNRVTPLFLEPRSALASFDEAAERWTLRVGCQSAHGMRAVLGHVLDVAPERIRVIVPDTGGGFGARGGVYPEYPLLLVAARRLGRPVKWTAPRTESFLSDYQARDHVLRGELGVDETGRFTAMRVRADWRHGAYFTSRNVWVMVHYFPPTLGGPYRIPMAHVSLRGVFSNTTPLAAYRGIGRIEANYLTESLIEAAARATGIDRVELRRRNLVRSEHLPWTTPGGAVLTSGAFDEGIARTLELSDWRNFPERRRASENAGRLRGIGLAMYVENDGSTPTEFAEVEATAAGRVVVRVGTQDFGMSHDTVFTQIAADALGVPFDVVDVVFGDTDQVLRGAGSHGSRSARMGGGAVVGSSRKLIELGRELAADRLEAASADVTYDAGRFTVVGTDRGIGLFEVARAASGRGERLAAQTDFVTTGDAHASGCHVCEVSVDPEDGTVTLERHVIVADVGRAINPMVVDGQMHGGAAQGVGQALMEGVLHDPDSGQLRSGSLMDYAIPRADDLPRMLVELDESVEPDNPLGVKGAGENATTGAPAAVMNAIRDALHLTGADHVDMPATAHRVWRALHGTAQGRLTDPPQRRP